MQTGKLFMMASCLTVLGLVVASCAPAAAPAPTPAPAATPTPKPAAPAPTSKPAGAEPRYGGVLSLPSPSDPPNLDIHLNGTAILFSPAGTVYNSIVQYDQNNKIVPDLAKSWEVSPDGNVYTFSLQPGVKAHDGQPFTSEDIKFSLERIVAYDLLKFITDAIQNIETADANTVKVTLKYRQSSFLALLAHGRALMAPKHVVEAKGDLKRDAVGTGPFKLKEYLSGVSFRTEKNGSYFVPGRPYLDGVNFYIIKDISARFAGFRTGRLQMYGAPPSHGELGPGQLEILKRENSQAVVRPYDVSQAYGLMPNWNRTPWNDVRVRRAAFLATDREKGIEVVSEGAGYIGVSVFSGEWALPKEELAVMPGFRKPKDQDIAEAKRLLAEAGYAQGFKSTVLVRAAIPIYEKAAVFMRDQLSKIGIDLSLQIVEYAIFVDARSKQNYDTMSVLNNVPLSDPDVTSTYISRKRGGQFSSGDDDKVLELFDKQSRAATVEERKQTVFELQRRIAEVVPHIMIGWQTSFIALSPQVQNYTFSSLVFSHNKLEGVWLSK